MFLRLRFACFVTIAGMLMLASTAGAVVLVTSCSTTCSANCELQNNIDCSGQSGIVLNSGADLEMAGHFLTCSSNCPTNAITITASNSVVHNDAGNAVDVEGGIDGRFNVGVACAARSGSTVRGIRIEDATYGMTDCAKVEQNVIIGSGAASTVGIYTDGVANSDYIKNNWIEKWAYNVLVSSYCDSDLLIEHNQIVMRDVATGQGGANEIGIQLVNGFTGALDIADNAFYGDATGASLFSFTSGNASFDANRCDPDKSMCTGCVFCAHPITPFH